MEAEKRKYLIVGGVLFVVVGLGYLFFTQKKEPASSEPVISSEVSEEQPAPTEPVVYHEIFEDPIDPNLEPERHREVYNKIVPHVSFDIIIPENLPSGYKLVAFEGGGDFYDDISDIVLTGGFVATYESSEGSFEILEGTGNPEGAGEVVTLNNGTEVWVLEYYSGDKIHRVVDWGGTSDDPFFITSFDLTTNELLNIVSMILAVTYSEVFEYPIDPNLEPERHKDVFRAVISAIDFDVLIPNSMPDGTKLVSFDGHDEGIKATYEYSSGSFDLIEGYADLGGLGQGTSVVFDNGTKGGVWSYPYKNGQITLITFGDYSKSKPYSIQSVDLSKEELVFIIEGHLLNK
ncbi:MAG: hypothetical protein KAR20_14945 [Candidatus Heimdallarchaeota archaeon]|nr:hypothetical protein [Candidatus Heimdallarchaeota archaeon]